MYNDFETKVSQVIDHHAPIKYRYPRKNSVPYMNREMRKAIYKKQMLRSKFEKYKTNKTWEAYRKQRNLVTKLKRNLLTHIFKKDVLVDKNLNIFTPQSNHFYQKNLHVRLPETCWEVQVVSHSDWQTWRSCQTEKYFAGPKKKPPKIHCHVHNV